MLIELYNEIATSKWTKVICCSRIIFASYNFLHFELLIYFWRCFFSLKFLSFKFETLKVGRERWWNYSFKRKWQWYFRIKGKFLCWFWEFIKYSILPNQFGNIILKISRNFQRFSHNSEKTEHLVIFDGGVKIYSRKAIE